MMLRYTMLVVLFTATACGRISQDIDGVCAFRQHNRADSDTFTPVRGALVSTRFDSYEQLKESIDIEYFQGLGCPGVLITHCSYGQEVTSVLTAGVSQDDFTAARDGGVLEKLILIIKSPYAVAHRQDLNRVYALSRRRSKLISGGMPAFYDISEATMGHVYEEDAKLLDHEDLTSEKGYFNTINHIGAQAFMTSLFSERLADLVADSHERKNMPELITGNFTAEQVADLETGPVDNYVDIINNEWGQELGKLLKEKYRIHCQTHWTPQLLTQYLNDLQSYYSWAFQIRFKPFRPGDEIVISFSDKINRVMHGRC